MSYKVIFRIPNPVSEIISWFLKSMLYVSQLFIREEEETKEKKKYTFSRGIS